MLGTTQPFEKTFHSAYQALLVKTSQVFCEPFLIKPAQHLFPVYPQGGKIIHGPGRMIYIEIIQDRLFHEGHFYTAGQYGISKKQCRFYGSV